MHAKLFSRGGGGVGGTGCEKSCPKINMLGICENAWFL